MSHLDLVLNPGIISACFYKILVAISSVALLKLFITTSNTFSEPYLHFCDSSAYVHHVSYEWHNLVQYTATFFTIIFIKFGTNSQAFLIPHQFIVYTVIIKFITNSFISIFEPKSYDFDSIMNQNVFIAVGSGHREGYDGGRGTCRGEGWLISLLDCLALDLGQCFSFPHSIVLNQTGSSSRTFELLEAQPDESNSSLKAAQPARGSINHCCVLALLSGKFYMS